MSRRFIAKEVNQHIQEVWQSKLETLNEHNIIPTLATVRVGAKSADISYEKGATKKMHQYNFGVENIVLPDDVEEDVLINKIKELSENNNIHGILLMQPLPERFDERKVKSAIASVKDVDCTTVGNLGAVIAGWEDCYPYCAPAAVMELLDYYKIELKGKNVCIIGSGLVVGKPLSMLMSNALATVSLCNVFTKDVTEFSKKADIIVSACGVPGLVDEKYVSEGQILIDVGTSFVDGKLRGDVDLGAVDEIVDAVTPTPGGISGITTTILAKHLISAAYKMYESGGLK